MRHLAFLLLLLSLQGCSFLFTGGPPAGHEKLRYFDCSSSPAAPVSDALLAGLELLMIAVLADTDPGESVNSAPIALFGTFAAMHVASGIYGTVKASSCDSAKQQLAQRVHDRDAEARKLFEDLQRLLAERQAQRSAAATTAPDVAPASEPVTTPEGSAVVPPDEPAAPPAPLPAEAAPATP